MIPFDRFGVILGDPLPGLIEDPQIELRRRVALLGRFTKPFGCLAVFLGDAVPGLVTDPEVTLGRGIVLIGGFSEPANGFRVILRDPLPGQVTNSQITLCSGIALLGVLACLFEWLPTPAVRLHRVAKLLRLAGIRPLQGRFLLAHKIDSKRSISSYSSGKGGK